VVKEELIAPCGLNCGICMAYLREKRRCAGCRIDDTNEFVTRVKCIIKNCEVIKTNKSGFCFECAEYPCKRLKQLDKRYRTKYSMSMLDNLESIKDIGLVGFVNKEKERWRCLKCGGTICVHRGYCYSCGERVTK
jgi:hypothetical protein